MFLIIAINSLIGFLSAILLLLERNGKIKLYFIDKQEKIFELIIYPRTAFELDTGEGIDLVIDLIEWPKYLILMTIIGIIPKIIWTIFHITVYLIVPIICISLSNIFWGSLEKIKKAYDKLSAC